MEVFVASATFPLLRRTINPYPGTTMSEAAEQLARPANRDTLVAVYTQAAAAEADWPARHAQCVSHDDCDDPRAIVRLSGLMLGLTDNELGPLDQHT